MTVLPAEPCQFCGKATWPYAVSCDECGNIRWERRFRYVDPDGRRRSVSTQRLHVLAAAEHVPFDQRVDYFWIKENPYVIVREGDPLPSCVVIRRFFMEEDHGDYVYPYELAGVDSVGFCFRSLADGRVVRDELFPKRPRFDQLMRGSAPEWTFDDFPAVMLSKPVETPLLRALWGRMQEGGPPMSFKELIAAVSPWCDSPPTWEGVKSAAKRLADTLARQSGSTARAGYIRSLRIERSDANQSLNMRSVDGGQT